MKTFQLCYDCVEKAAETHEYFERSDYVDFDENILNEIDICEYCEKEKENVKKNYYGKSDTIYSPYYGRITNECENTSFGDCGRCHSCRERTCGICGSVTEYFEEKCDCPTNEECEEE